MTHTFEGPLTIEWRITGRCNQACSYCYGPAKSIHPSDSLVEEILHSVVDSSAKYIRFSGGEPLLFGPLPSVIASLYRAGKKVILSTNGYKFVELRPTLEPFLTKLNLSLDGYDERTHSLCGRTPAGFREAIACLDALSEVIPAYTVKVGTVITSISALEPQLLERMYAIIASKHVHRWKIYQYIPEGPIVDTTLTISDTAFRELELRFREFLNKSSTPSSSALEVTFAPAVSRTGAYFIIEPLGDVIVPIGDSRTTREVHIGNIVRTRWEVLMKRWDKVCDDSNHLLNNSHFRTLPILQG